MNAISIENVCKAYRLGAVEESHDTRVAATLSWLQSPIRNFQRLKQLNTFSDQTDDAEIHWAPARRFV